MGKKSKRNILSYKRKKTKRNHINRRKRNKTKKKTQIGSSGDQIVPAQPIPPSEVVPSLQAAIKQVEENMEARLFALQANLQADIQVHKELIIRLNHLYDSLSSEQNMIKRILKTELSVNWNQLEKWSRVSIND